MSAAGQGFTLWLTLERREDTPDGTGGVTTDWRPLGRIAVAPSGGGGVTDRGDADATPRSRMRVFMRHMAMSDTRRPRIGDRMIDGGQRFAIVHVGRSKRWAQLLQIDLVEVST